MLRRCVLLTASLLSLLSTFSSADAGIVFFGDDRGNVAKYDTVSATGAFLGTIAGFNPGQALGLAYNGASSEVLILDRNTDRVFRMNDISGASVLAFNSSGTFQGGAVSGGLVYGISENTQQVVAFDFGGTQQVTGSGTPSHTHAVGVNAASGQVYLMGTDNVIRAVNANGTLGASIVTATGLPEFVDDMEYFGGDFLVTAFGNDQVYRVNGVTGISSLYLSAAQLNAMGLTGSMTGIAVQSAGNAEIPEPASVVLLAIGGCIGVAGRRWRAKFAA